MQHLRQTLDKLEAGPRWGRGWRWTLVVLGVLALPPWLLWAYRGELLAFAAHRYCAERTLECSLDVEVLDFRHAELVDVSIAENGEILAAAARLEVDISWPRAFAPAAKAIRLEEAQLALNLTGDGPVLGGLDRFRGQVDGGDGADWTLPTLNADSVDVTLMTPAGPIVGAAELAFETLADFRLSFVAEPTQLEYDGARLDLRAARGGGTSSGGDVAADILLDVAELSSPNARIEKLRFSASFNQVEGAISVLSDASADTLAWADGGLAEINFSATAEADAVDPNHLGLSAVLASLNRLSAVFTMEEGAFDDASWEGAAFDLALAPEREGKVVAGASRALLRDFDHTLAGAQLAEFNGRITLDIEPGDTPSLAAAGVDGDLTLQNARASDALRGRLADYVPENTPSPLKSHANALARVISRAGEAFDVSAPVELGYAVAGGEASVGGVLNGPTSLRAASGFQAELRPFVDGAPLMKWQPGEHGEGAFAFDVRGGGGPRLSGQIVGLDWTPRGAVMGVSRLALSPWRVGDARLGGTFDNVTFRPDPERYGILGEADLELIFSGPAYGSIYDQLRIGAPIYFDHHEYGWGLDVRGGALDLAFDGMSGPAFELGGMSTRYLPNGPLLERTDGGFRGEGRFEPATFPLKTAGREFEVEISSTALSWRSEDGVWAAFDVAPFRMDMLEDAARHPIRVEDVNGQVRSKNGWSLAGDISGVSAMFGDIQMDQGVAGYRLAGGGGASLSGGLSDVSAQFRDGADTQRFAPMAFSGGGDLAGGVAAFTGRFFDDESGVSIAAGAGRHELETGSGLFSLTPTPLVFRRGGLQPADLVPRLRGVAANVEGRVDVSGVVSWTRENVESTALVLVSDLGFATAGAGVFEGVNARVELDDVLNVRSPPGQVATIARLNPGVPIEDGRLRFQLLGPGQIELESAVWPFAGGSLAILPTIWDTDAEENLVTAEARDLDISDIVERFNIPDAVAIGRVSGRFPMAFGVGGVVVKDAALQADESGGTLQYLGDIGAAASDTDRSVKLFFDAVKNFKYRVLRIGLDGDVAGEMTLSLALEGHNPDVLDGFPFNLNVGLTADLVSLLNSRSPAQAYVDAVVDAVSGGQETQFD